MTTKMVKIKVKCSGCKGSGQEEEVCGGDSMDMWNCARGHCNINHKMKECFTCKGKGWYAREEELAE